MRHVGDSRRQSLSCQPAERFALESIWFTGYVLRSRRPNYVARPMSFGSARLKGGLQSIACAYCVL